MSDTPNADHFDEVLAAYLEAVDAGWAPDRGVLLRRYPSLRAELEEYFAAQDRVRVATASLDCPTKTWPGNHATPDGPLPRALDDYDDLEEIARGGMGVVFRARQKSLNRVVALKMVLSGSFASADELRRFRNEAEAAAQMDHPHIVPIYEVGEHDGRPYFSMKFVEGGCLTDHLPRLRQDVRAGATLLMKVARAVHYAHQRGVLHRDLKPGNVLIDTNGEPHVTDFGLAKRFEAAGDLTQSGEIVGTANYMSPEQAWGKSGGLTTAADVHALGAMLYELLTGRPPFASEDVVDTLLKVRTAMPPSPGSIAPRTDAELETICLKCLQKEPEQRYGSAAAMADDLERWLRGEVIAARRVGPGTRLRKWARRNPLVAALLGAVALVLLVGSVVATCFGLHAKAQAELAWANEQSAKVALAVAEEEKQKAVTEENLKARQLMTLQLLRVESVIESDPVEALLLLHDPLACPPHQRDAAWGFYERRCRRAQPATFSVEDARLASLAFSPDGRTLASASPFGFDRAVRLWDLASAKPRGPLDGHPEGVRAVTFSPDGMTLAAATGKEIWLWDFVTGRHNATLSGHPESVAALVFSPDGETLAAVSSRRDYFEGPAEVYLWDVRAESPRAVLKGCHGWSADSVAFSPDGRILAVAAVDSDDPQETGRVGLYDVKSGRALALPENRTMTGRGVAFSPDGLTLATVRGNPSSMSEVWLWDVRSGRREAVLGDMYGSPSVAFSPDGLTLAVSSMGGSVRLWDWKNKRLQTTLRDAAGKAVFSPDGRTLACGSDGRAVKLWDVAAWEAKASLMGHESSVQAVAFSPDGLTLASGSHNQTVRLWNTRTGQLGASWREDGRQVLAVAFSPDGRTLASGSGVWLRGPQRDAPGEVRLRDVRGGQAERVLGGHAGQVNAVAFSPNGRTLASGSFDQTVRLWDVNTGQTTATLRGHDHPVTSVAFRPDGLALASGSGTLLEGVVGLWDLRTGQLTTHLQGHKDAVLAVAYSPDSLTLASGSGDKTVRLWDARTGEIKTTLLGHTDRVTAVAFSPDGSVLATCAGHLVGGEVWLWDTKTGQHKATLQNNNDETGPAYYPVTTLAFSPDGLLLAGGSDDDTVKLWNLDPRPHDPERDWEERMTFEPANRRWWHEVQAANAELRGEWFAASFHLGQLLKDKPEDADLKRRRDQALDKLKPPAPMEPLPRP